MKKIIVFLFCLGAVHAQTILFLGDSLTEGYGISKEQAYPDLVKKRLVAEFKKDFVVMNGGVSGSTTNDALPRLRWYLKQKPDIVFVALGANDGLRGYDLTKSKENLEHIIELAQKSGAKVLLAGMLLPPNYGEKYVEDFKQIYIQLQKKYKLGFYPFLLDGVAGLKQYNLSDGIHPNEKGHKIMAEKIFKFLKEEL